MNKLTVDLPLWNLERIDRLAEASGASASEVVATLIDAALHDIQDRHGNDVLAIISYGLTAKGFGDGKRVLDILLGEDVERVA